MFSGTAAFIGLQQLKCSLQGKWWQDQAQFHVGQGLALNKITVPETEPVTATPSRGDFGQQTTCLDWAEGLSTAHSGFDKTKGFHSISQLTQSKGSATTALGDMLGKLVAALGAARHPLFICTVFLAEAPPSLTSLFLRGIGATLLQIAVRALFTQRQLELF